MNATTLFLKNGRNVGLGKMNWKQPAGFQQVAEQILRFDFVIRQVTLACYVPQGTATVFHRNRRNDGFAIMLEMPHTYYFESGEVVTVPKDGIIFMPKGSTYRVESQVPQQAGGCYAINFDLADVSGLPPFSFLPKHPQSLLHHFQAAERGWKTKNLAYQEKCRSELYAILHDIKQECFFKYVPQRQADRIQPAMQYIHAEYTNGQIEVGKLAHLCHLGETAFRALFAAVYHTTPKKYMQTLRLSHAEELLRSELYSVREAMEMSGFTDEAYFSRIFKAHFGVSPKNYRTK